MESLRDNAAAILRELQTLGFVLGSGDRDGCRVLLRRNADGHADLKVGLVFGDGNTLNHLCVYGLDGGVGETIDWSMDLTAGTPLAGFVAFMRSV